MCKRILIVEDDADIAELLRLNLADLGFHIEVFNDGQKAWDHYRQHPFDLAILDLMLPGLDGLEVCKRIRNSTHYDTAILMLTSRSSELDRVLGLELGADDYLTKPFSLLELMARVKALLRRSGPEIPRHEEHRLDFGQLSIDPTRREVLRSGQMLDLTAKEFDLLHYFATNPGQVFSRMQLLDSVWGYSHEGYEHTVNSHMNRLRSKLEEDPKHPQYVKTVWGVGYQFVAHPT